MSFRTFIIENYSVNISYDKIRDFIFELKGYKLPKNIIDKNSGKILKERQAIILLDINQQSIAMYDYEIEDFGSSVRFKLPISNFPYTLDSNDILQVTGTFSK
jgi:hypothetical protein